jgi:hypothetical protein
MSGRLPEKNRFIQASPSSIIGALVKKIIYRDDPALASKLVVDILKF